MKQKSIVAVSDSAGALIGINRYDEYGIPASTNIGRFQYTGQAFLAEAGLHHYKGVSVPNFSKVTVGTML